MSEIRKYPSTETRAKTGASFWTLSARRAWKDSGLKTPHPFPQNRADVFSLQNRKALRRLKRAHVWMLASSIACLVSFIAWGYFGSGMKTLLDSSMLAFATGGVAYTLLLSRGPRNSLVVGRE